MSGERPSTRLRLPKRLWYKPAPLDAPPGPEQALAGKGVRIIILGAGAAGKSRCVYGSVWGSLQE
jgi:hypothetical protein